MLPSQQYNPIFYLLTLALVGAAAIVLFANPPARPIVSRWGLPTRSDTAPLTGVANDLRGVTQVQGAAPVPVSNALEAYNAQSELIASAGDGSVRLFRRNLPSGGQVTYMVVELSVRTHVEVINADGATPASDERGDTIWADGQKHLATVTTMVNAPYAQRVGKELLGAMAFGFHGGERTSNEGTVVINSAVHRVNPWRSALCIRPDRRAVIGLFSADDVQDCAQAIGGGPVVLWGGKIATTEVQTVGEQFIPFNPLGEDFVQLDWRKKIYNGSYPKTAVGIGKHPGGNDYLVLMVSNGIGGVEMAAQLLALGCTDALGGDDDTSTQLAWRGQAVFGERARAVPDAIAVYLVRGSVCPPLADAGLWRATARP
ncbi:phosphodiester glycosidase family protein [Candidatus Gracilibacteria bacterium]|nr:phosphodiester glycosidase family protein [Candidatus Gracilibacteria bacterium]